MTNEMRTSIRRLANWRGWAYGLFWSWNIIFLAFMLLGFAPQLLPEMINELRAGTIPVAFVVYAAILAGIPVVIVILGLTILRRSPGRLFALGYGIEGPLMLMLALRFFLLRQVMPAVALLLSIAGLGMATLLWQLLDRDIDRRGPLASHLRVAGLTLLLLTGLYVGTWIAFYTAPICAWGWEGLSSIITHGLGISEWRQVPLAVPSFLLVVYTATLFIATPIAVPILYVRAWRRGIRALVEKHGELRAILLVAVVLALCSALFIQVNRQPQHQAFALLEEPPSTFTEAQMLQDKQDAIRAGLLNAYLAPVRYVSAVGQLRHVSDMYENALGLSQYQAAYVRQLYEIVARPVLYVSVHEPEPDIAANTHPFRVEPVEAADLYETFFDQTIIDGEHDTIVHAVRSTWSIEQAQTAWEAVDDRAVHLAHQEITVAEHGDWAEVELYEVYQNRTGQRQEVIYYFSLPESAVITGVWLGNSTDRDARFAYRVSPRGAAQAVYRNELRRNVDPALVEQIGPCQYRLRVFPVEPQTRRWSETSNRSIVEDGPQLHMWLTWRMLASDNAWPLPRLADKRNVFWDEASVRLVNGGPMAIDEEMWLPRSVPASSPMPSVAHRVDFPGGVTVIARPALDQDLPSVPDDLRLAVVVDRSGSMAQYAASVTVALARLAEVTGGDAGVDAYLTTTKYRGEPPSRIGLAKFTPDNILYLGGQNAAELLVQFDVLRDGENYDAIIVLTDGSGYELNAGDIEVPIPDAPVWVVHLDGEFPVGYDDATLQAIQASGGGVAGNVSEALTRLTVALEAEHISPADVIDGYVWSIISTRDAEADTALAADTAGGEFAALAARRLILDAMRRQRGALNDPDTLDALHAVAIEHGIVTPYSSMIVLVTERQQQLLDQLEESSDRFQREYEEVGETEGQRAVVTGVPEPEEWLLLALAAAMLIWYVSKTRSRAGRDRIP